MDRSLKERFWEEFYIPTQTESKEVAFANPADVANALINCRNWYGTISEDLVALEDEISKVKRFLRDSDRQVVDLEADVLKQFDRIPTTALKNTTTKVAFIRRHSDQATEECILQAELLREDNQEQLLALESEKAQTEMMRRAIEKTADWLVQYVNWQKFEMREF